MGVKAKVWEFLTEVHSDRDSQYRLPGVDFSKLFAEMKEANIKYCQFTITEIVDWDIAPMRKYIHAATYPAFTKEYNDTCGHPANGHFHTSEIKDFLKAKFIGWNKKCAGWEKWNKILRLDQPIADIFAYLKIAELNKSLDTPVEIASSENLTPEQYMMFIKDCEAYYFELFHKMYDTRSREDLLKNTKDSC